MPTPQALGLQVPQSLLLRQSSNFVFYSSFPSPLRPFVLVSVTRLGLFLSAHACKSAAFPPAFAAAQGAPAHRPRPRGRCRDIALRHTGLGRRLVWDAAHIKL